VDLDLKLDEFGLLLIETANNGCHNLSSGNEMIHFCANFIGKRFGNSHAFKRIGGLSSILKEIAVGGSTALHHQCFRVVPVLHRWFVPLKREWYSANTTSIVPPQFWPLYFKMELLPKLEGEVSKLAMDEDDLLHFVTCYFFEQEEFLERIGESLLDAHPGNILYFRQDKVLKFAFCDFGFKSTPPSFERSKECFLRQTLCSTLGGINDFIRNKIGLMNLTERSLGMWSRFLTEEERLRKSGLSDQEYFRSIRSTFKTYLLSNLSRFDIYNLGTRNSHSKKILDEEWIASVEQNFTNLQEEVNQLNIDKQFQMKEIVDLKGKYESQEHEIIKLNIDKQLQMKEIVDLKGKYESQEHEIIKLKANLAKLMAVVNNQQQDL
jgi:hypothetical protein